MLRISYAIPVCNEHEELDRILTQLTKFVDPIHDEIVVQCDEGNTTPQVYEVIKKHADKIKVVEYPLKGDFASFKNNLKANCTGARIVQLDADELLSEWLLENLPTILQDNPTIDLFCLPRINTVDQIGLSHVQRWGWNISKINEYIEEAEFDLTKQEDLDQYELLKAYGLIIEETEISCYL